MISEKIRTYQLTSQEMGFISGVGDFVGQWRSNRFKCIPRNTNMLINAQGNYTFCFNDIRHSHEIGHVRSMSLRQALAMRESKGPDSKICDVCTLRGRYRPRSWPASPLPTQRPEFQSRDLRGEEEIRRKTLAKLRPADFESRPVRSCGQELARPARGRSAAGAVLSCGVHAAGKHRGHRLSEQGRDLRRPVALIDLTSNLRSLDHEGVRQI